MEYWPQAGINLAVVPGSKAFVAHEEQPDRFSFSTANNWAGAFQQFFARMTDPRDPVQTPYPSLQVALPSASVASAQFNETWCD
jgi:hypothetical protein